MKTSKSAFVGALLLLAAFAMAQETKPGFNVTHPKVPKATETDTYGINNGGTIAGDYVDAAGIQHGMTLKGTKFVTFDHPGCSTAVGSATAGYGLNDWLVLVGRSSPTTGGNVGFQAVWHP